MSTADTVTTTPVIPPLTTAGRSIILVCAFLGWFFCGFHMAITSMVMRPAAIDLLGKVGEIDSARFQEFSRAIQQSAKSNDPSLVSDADRKQHKAWNGQVIRLISFLTCSFLFGAATGGLLFGRLGDVIGRSKAMALSIITYSGMAAAAQYAQSPQALLAMWFLACTGVGGMWPNGVALLSEAWGGLSRPMVAGLIGTSANIGIYLLSWVADQDGYRITPDTWSSFLRFGAWPIVLGLFSLFAVPESPRWLASRFRTGDAKASGPGMALIFRRPLLTTTLVGIALATVPIIGGWGSANWMISWGDLPDDPGFKAKVLQSRSLTGLVGSLLGGWVGSLLGRRHAYFLVSLACLGFAQYTFWFSNPRDPLFLYWVGALGFFSGIYFGWLPLFLPELFPTSVRSMGAGVSFNFGRILTAVTVFATGALTSYFNNDYARMGQVTSLIFAVGMVAIFFAPDTSARRLED